MDKQEMVSKCCGAKMTVECSDLSEEALRYLELPRELPLDIDCTHSECIRRQRDNDQRILNKWIKVCPPPQAHSRTGSRSNQPKGASNRPL